MSSPLEGKRLLVTRPRHQIDELANPLRAMGAEVYTLPAIEIAAPEDFADLDDALRALEQFDWVVFTSVNGVTAVERRMQTLGIPASHLNDRKLVVIGPATAEEARRAFRAPDLMPSEYVSESVAEALGEVGGQSFLLLRADIARRDLPEMLTASGAVVRDVAAYRIVPPPASEAYSLPKEAPDAILVTSSSSVRGTQRALQDRGLGDWMAQSALICIGPITADTAVSLGIRPAAVADPYTIPGLIAATQHYFAKELRS